MKSKFILIVIGIMHLSLNIYSQGESKLLNYNLVWKDPDLYGCYEKILISIEQDQIQAYEFSFCDAVGGSPSFLSGIKEGNSYVGNRINLAFNDEGDLMGADTSKFEFEFSSDTSFLILTNYTSSGQNKVELNRIKANYSFKNGMKKLYETPISDSRFLMEFDTGKIYVKLLEIGKTETIDNVFDFWYRVEVNSLSGWVFGGLELH